MAFRAQIHCADEDGRLCPLDPQDVSARTHKEAAEVVCGAGLVDAGHIGKLAVKVWTSGHNPPDIKLFYRA
jgi:hypothetical protein